ncbi:hypothetical protein EGT74_10085 [Chitinophaga lutea]|uniref:Uncharacterized protein n=1 Tax=Chitinophaga lutea TaxID=2488634 RepID=A0A3N4Q3P1_9BACT|nr:hypothetical protein EGT74_10085 [Chitinophaga lutea]
MPKEEMTITRKDTSYRALGNYYWDEIARLKNQQLNVSKVVRINGQADSALVRDSASLEALFRPLMDADISKPSLADAYDADTIVNQLVAGDTTFILQSKGKQTNPYQLILDVDRDGRIKTARVTAYTSNLVYEYRQEILYERSRQLRVSTFQKIIFMKPEHLEVQAWFLPAKA